MEKRYELMLDESYMAVWNYRSVGQRRDGSSYPDKGGSISGFYIQKSELSDPPPGRLSVVVSAP